MKLSTAKSEFETAVRLQRYWLKKICFSSNMEDVKEYRKLYESAKRRANSLRKFAGNNVIQERNSSKFQLAWT